jgi:hypothetical protein
MAENVSMIGYTRASEADCSQVNNLQHDALIAEGVDLKRIYQACIWGWEHKSGNGLRGENGS